MKPSDRKKIIVIFFLLIGILIGVITVCCGYFLLNYYLKFKIISYLYKKYGISCNIKEVKLGTSEINLMKISCIAEGKLILDTQKVKVKISSIKKFLLLKDTIRLSIEIKGGELQINLNRLFHYLKTGFKKNEKRGVRHPTVLFNIILYNTNFKTIGGNLSLSCVLEEMKFLRNHLSYALVKEIEIKKEPFFDLYIDRAKIEKGKHHYKVNINHIEIEKPLYEILKKKKIKDDELKLSKASENKGTELLSSLDSLPYKFRNIELWIHSLSSPLIKGHNILKDITFYLKDTLLKLEGSNLWMETKFDINNSSFTNIIQIEKTNNFSILLKASGFPISNIFKCDPNQFICVDERSLLELTLNLKRESVNKLPFELNLNLAPITIKSEHIAKEPLKDIAVALKLKGKFLKKENRIELNPLSIYLNNLSSELKGNVILGSGGVKKFSGIFGFDNISCNDFIQELPQPLIGDLKQIKLDGILSLKINFELDLERIDSSDILISIKNNCKIVEPGFLEPTTFKNPFIIFVRSGDGYIEFPTGPGSENWTPLKEISKPMIYAVITTEDATFFHHNGFSTKAIKESILKNIKERRFVRGASTITMQVAKNLFLSREKTVARKIQEVFYTWWLESNFTKEEIIELYLNIIEFGPNLYGIKQASQFYFGVSPSNLTPIQAVFLARLLPNPYSRGYKYWEENYLPKQWKEVLINTLKLMYEKGYITREELESSLEEEIKFNHGESPLTEYTIY